MYVFASKVKWKFTIFYLGDVFMLFQTPDKKYWPCMPRSEAPKRMKNDGKSKVMKIIH